MSRRVIHTAFTLLAAAGIGLSAASPGAASPAATAVLTSAASPGVSAGPARQAGTGALPGVNVQAMIGNMTLAEKVGQMFVSYVYGDTATTTDPAYVKQNQSTFGVDNGAQLIAKYNVGGIIYFDWTGSENDPSQTAGLSNGLQQAAMAQPQHIPLEIGTDQEGGRVVRIAAPAAVSPGNMAIGATFAPGDSRRMASVTGQQLRAMGLNADYAPVVDVNTNPTNTTDGTRSFADQAAAVSRLGAAAVRGYQGAGVASTLKHFPGLGDTTVNTDSGIAVNNETRQQVYDRDIPPFRSAVAAGTDMVMAGHVVVPALDPSGQPASLSQPIVTGVLRDQLGFNGVVITDSLGAGALAKIPPAQVILDAINAGDDELLDPPNLANAEQTVITAVQNGTISEQRIDTSVARILTMKARLGLFANPYTTQQAVQDQVGNPGQLATAASVSQHSITLVKNQGGVLPLRPGSGKNVLVTGWGLTSVPALASDLAGHGVTTSVNYTGSNPSAAAINASVAAAKQSDDVVVTTNDLWGDSGQQQLVQNLVATGKPVTVVALDTPYDAAYVTGAPAFLGAYGYQPDTLAAVANTIFGASPVGRLPVNVAAAGQPSQILYPYGYGLSYRP